MAVLLAGALLLGAPEAVARAKGADDRDLIAVLDLQGVGTSEAAAVALTDRVQNVGQGARHSAAGGTMRGGLVGLDYGWVRKRWEFTAGGGFYAAATSYTVAGSSQDLRVTGVAFVGSFSYRFRNGMILGGEAVAAVSGNASGSRAEAAAAMASQQTDYGSTMAAFLVGWQFRGSPADQGAAP